MFTGDVAGADRQLRVEDMELLEMLDTSAAGAAADNRIGSGSLSHRSISTNLSSRASSAATLTCGNMAKYSLQQLCHLGMIIKFSFYVI